MKKFAFTLIEILIVLSFLSIFLLIIFPIIKNANQNIRFKATLEKMKNIKKAIIGDLEEVVENKLIEGGYFSDIGDLPNSLNDLVINPGVPGWNGPYIESKNGAFKIDGWGNEFIYDNLAGTIKSKGEDGILGTPDDITTYIYYPISNLENNTIRVYVRDATGRILSNSYLEVNIKYPYSSWQNLSYTNGYFYLNNVPAGTKHKINTNIFFAELGENIEQYIVVYPLSTPQNYHIHLHGEIKEDTSFY